MTVSDLISRQDAIEVLTETIAPPSVTLDTLVMRIDALPSAEAVQGVGRYESAVQKLREMPRYLNGVKAKQIAKVPSEAVQGEWIDNHNGTFTCDQCGCKHSKSNFCPNCGARMKGCDSE